MACWVIDWFYIKIVSEKVDKKFIVEIAMEKIILDIIIIDENNIYI